jgi:CRP-like cAMP-binding protein
MSEVPLAAARLAALLRQAWLGGADEVVVQQALRSARLRALGDGELLFARGDAGDGIYIVASGIVRFSRSTRGGSTSIIGLLAPGDWFGELSSFDGLPRTHDAHAVGATVLVQHGTGDFERLLQIHPQLYAAFVRLLSRRMRQIYDWTEEATVADAQARLARRVLALARPECDGVLAVAMSQEQFGQLLGRTRQSVARLLTDWEAKGVVRLGYRRLRVLDAERLKAMADCP